MSARPIVESRTGRPAFWMLHTVTCTYHASVDGQKAICGVRNNLVRESRPSVLQGLAGLTACGTCLERIRYVEGTKMPTVDDVLRAKNEGHVQGVEAAVAILKDRLRTEKTAASVSESSLKKRFAYAAAVMERVLRDIEEQTRRA